MADTIRDMLSRPPTGLKVVAYQRDCGYHVIVSETKPRNDGAYVPRIIAKACVNIYVPPSGPTVKQTMQAYVIGVHAILTEEPQTCHNL